MSSVVQHSLVSSQDLSSFVEFCDMGKIQFWCTIILRKYFHQNKEKIKYLPPMHLSSSSQWLSFNLYDKPIEIRFFHMSDLSDKLHGEVCKTNKFTFSKKTDGVVPLY